jgi:hypothetical protein
MAEVANDGIAHPGLKGEGVLPTAFGAEDTDSVTRPVDVVEFQIPDFAGTKPVY